MLLVLLVAHVACSHGLGLALVAVMFVPVAAAVAAVAVVAVLVVCARLLFFVL